MLELPRAPLSTKRFRLIRKQPRPSPQTAQPRCDYDGCRSKDTARTIVQGGSYCPWHARQMRRETAPRPGVCTLDDWSDDLVAEHLLEPMTDTCDDCHSKNFPEPPRTSLSVSIVFPDQLKHLPRTSPQQPANISESFENILRASRNTLD